MADVPFMLQPVNGGVGMGSDGIFNMGMWGQQSPTIPSTGSGIPFAPQYGGFGTNPSAVPGQPTTWLDRMKGDLGNGMEGFGQGLSAFSNLANIYAGFKSLGLAKDQLQFAKSSFNKNFNAQAQAYNNELKDRWESRSNAHATRGRSYEGMDTWLAGRQIESTGKNRDRVNSAQP